MLVLHTKPLSIREEIHKVLAVENKRIEDFKGLMDFLLRLEGVRRDLHLSEEKWNRFFNPKTTIPHDKLEVYLRILLNLNIYLNIPNVKGKSLLNFQYRSTMDKSWIRNNSFYFETVMAFYNYGALYFNSGYALIKVAKDASDSKQALNSFRIAFWAFQECYQGRRFCLSSGRLPAEVSNNSLEILMALCVAFGYLGMTRAMGMQLANFSTEDRCRLYCAVSKHLMHAERLLAKNSGKQFTNKDILMGDIFWFKNLFYCKCFYEMAEDYRLKHEERVTAGHIGWQLGYLNALDECFGNLMKANKALLKSQTQLITATRELLKKKARVELENKEVYKVALPPKKDLILKEPKSKLKSLERPNCKTVMPELKKVFSNKKCQNFNRILADLDVLINTNRNNLFGMIDRIQKKKIFVYQDLRIDTLLSSVSKESTNKIAKQLHEIKTDYGGYMGYLQLTGNLQEMANKNDQRAKTIVNHMQRDRDSDFAFQRATGIKIPSLKESNPDLVKQFEKHGVGLTALKKKDKELMTDFEKYSDTLRKAEEEKFVALLSTLSEGLGNINGSEQLVKMDSIVNQWFDGRILTKKKEILQYYKSLDLEEMVINIFMNRFSEEQTYLDLNDKLDKRTEEINDHIEKQHTALNKMAEVARKVNLQVTTHKGVLEKKQRLVSEINGAALLYTMLLNNLELHANFEKALDLINQSVSDYMTSKELQKQEIQNERRGGMGGPSNQGGGGGGYYGGAPSQTPNHGGNATPGKNNGSKDVSNFLSDILKDQGFDFKF